MDAAVHLVNGIRGDGKKKKKSDALKKESDLWIPFW